MTKISIPQIKHDLRLPHDAPSLSPIVNISSADFVAALERTDHHITALDHLEGFLAILGELRKPVECLYCGASGNLTNPFEEDENATETCCYCQGKGRVVPDAYANLIGDERFAALNTFAADLRALSSASMGQSS